MITKEQIIEILNNHAGYIDRSRTEQAVHEDNFNYIADEILSKFCQHDVISAVCGNCKDVQGMYLGMTCPRCNRPFRDVKAN